MRLFWRGVDLFFVLFCARFLSESGAVYAHFFTWKSGTAHFIVGLLPKFDWLLILTLAGLTEILTRRGMISGDGDACGWVARLGIWRRTWVFALTFALTWAFGMFGKTSFLYNQF